MPRITWSRITIFAVSAGLVTASLVVTNADAKSRKSKDSPDSAKDAIEVVGHIPATDGAVRRFFTTQHYSSFYLYAERDAGKNLTLIDVTKTDQPAVLGEVSYAPGQAGSVSSVAGTAALVTSDAPVQTPVPQTLKIMDFSDPQNPKAVREFNGITALNRDDRRGLIFVANGEGIWILRQHLAEDPAVQQSYANYVLYGSSMYR